MIDRRLRPAEKRTVKTRLWLWKQDYTRTQSNHFLPVVPGSGEQDRFLVRLRDRLTANLVVRAPVVDIFVRFTPQSDNVYAGKQRNPQQAAILKYIDIPFVEMFRWFIQSESLIGARDSTAPINRERRLRCVLDDTRSRVAVVSFLFSSNITCYLPAFFLSEMQSSCVSFLGHRHFQSTRELTAEDRNVLILVSGDGRRLAPFWRT